MRSESASVGKLYILPEQVETLQLQCKLLKIDANVVRKGCFLGENIRP